MSIELMYKMFSNEQEIRKRSLENSEFEKRIITYLANDFLPIKERLHVFLNYPAKRLGSVCLSDLPPIIKFVAEVYDEIFLTDLSREKEVSLKHILMKLILNDDGSYKKDFLNRNNINESALNKEICSILKNNYTCLIYD